ncbi:MAG: hypothetical protein ACOVQR_00680 [Flavobacterium sp.]|jgi:hypothetical protein|uniref:hypothetical protein n=1 Tax=Flavobacterium sp. TaxID=239 RepID=UPI003BA47B8F
MKKELTFDLINGNFLPEDAKSVLLNLVKYKISYHELELFSAAERFGKDLPHSKTRIAQLKQSMGDVENFFNAMEKNEISISISAKVEVVCKENSQLNELVSR